MSIQHVRNRRQSSIHQCILKKIGCRHLLVHKVIIYLRWRSNKEFANKVFPEANSRAGCLYRLERFLCLELALASGSWRLRCLGSRCAAHGNGILGNRRRHQFVRDVLTRLEVAPTDNRVKAKLHACAGSSVGMAAAAGATIGPSVKIPIRRSWAVRVAAFVPTATFKAAPRNEPARATEAVRLPSA